MIRPIDIRLNAAHPELPLCEAVTFTGSPSTVLIRGVPPNCGRWAITAVFVAASFPDGSTTTRAAVQSANGVWVATLPATATSGRTANGIRIMADGIDENGEAVTGYILGVADFAVASLDVTPAPEPGETSYQMLYFDEVPSTLRKGDVTKIDGVLKFYNGSAWEPFAAPVTLDNTVTRASANGVKSSGIWSAIWGALSALPAGFSSLYDWCVAQLAGKASKADVDPLLFAQYYPEGNVKSAAEFTAGIKYDAPDTTNRTITVKPFCNTGIAENDNSNLSGRVVIPPFVDGDGSGYISDDGTRFKVVGVGNYGPSYANKNLTAIVAPTTATTIGDYAFTRCALLVSVSFPAATTIGEDAFSDDTSLTSVSFPAVTSIEVAAFGSCTSLTSVSFPAVTSIEGFAFDSCTSLASVDFGGTPRSSVPTLGSDAFVSVPTSCKIIVPDDQYDAWTTASGWSDLVTAGYTFLRHSEWEYARKYELDGKLDKSGGTMTPAFAVPTILSGEVVFGAGAGGPYIGMAHEQNTIMLRPNGVEVNNRNTALAALNPTPGNIAALDDNGNPTDSTIPATNVALKDNIPYSIGTPIVVATAQSEVVEGETVYYGAATLADRTANIVQVTAATALDELRITFPAATSGKVRDFGLHVEIGTGSAALAAPALVPIAPTGETINLKNADGAIPALADGTATAKGVTLLYFSETAPGVFVVKGEQVEEVA